MMMAAIFSLGLSDVVGVRGFLKNKTQTNIDTEGFQQCRQHWNPVLFAVEQGHLHIVKFFVEFLQINAKLSLCNPIKADTDNEIDHVWHHDNQKGFALILCVQNTKYAMFNYLINDLYYLWQINEL